MLNAQQQQQLLDYLTLLERWNKTYNLTAVRNTNDMLVRHIMDSLVVMPWLTGKRFIDVGTGAGLPGIPLAVAMPDCTFTLLDSLGKRVRFLRQVQHQLALKNINIQQTRVEDFLTDIPFDGVISRAFASLSDMVNWCKHLTDNNGLFYALKGQQPTDEIQLLPAGVCIEKIVNLRVPELNAERCLVIITPDNTN